MAFICFSSDFYHVEFNWSHSRNSETRSVNGVENPATASSWVEQSKSIYMCYIIRKNYVMLEYCVGEQNYRNKTVYEYIFLYFYS